MALGTSRIALGQNPQGSDYVAVAEFNTTTQVITGAWEFFPIVSDSSTDFEDSNSVGTTSIEVVSESGAKTKFDPCSDCVDGGGCAVQSGSFSFTTLQRDAPTMNLHETMVNKYFAFIKLGSCSLVNGKNQWTAYIGKFVNPGNNKHKGQSKTVKFKGYTHTAAITILGTACALVFKGAGTCATVTPPDIVIPCGNFTHTVDITPA